MQLKFLNEYIPHCGVLDDLSGELFQLHKSDDCIGPANGFYGKKHTEESRKLMIKNHADFRSEKHPSWGSKRSDESKRNMSIAQYKRWKGISHTEETKRKIKISMKLYYENKRLSTPLHQEEI